MNKEKQIEEMAKVLCEDYGECKKCTLSNPECENPCMISEDCERLYNAGYRKRSEGEWLTTDAYPHHLYCSLCYKTALPNVEYKERWGLEMNYCPNCGAKMTGGAE